MHRILVLTAGGLLAVGAALLPTAYYQNIPTARYVTASTQPGTESVSCSGQILAFDRAETYITSPVVTEDVLVEVGDQVAAGQVLCTVDLPATGLLMTSPELTSDFLKSYLENPEASSLESLLSASGLGEQSVQLAAAPEYASAINGTVTAVNLQSDSLYNSPQAAIVVEDLSELRAELYVPQAGVAGIEPGDKVLIQGAGITGEISGFHQSVCHAVAAEWHIAGANSGAGPADFRFQGSPGWLCCHCADPFPFQYRWTVHTLSGCLSGRGESGVCLAAVQYRCGGQTARHHWGGNRGNDPDPLRDYR